MRGWFFMLLFVIAGCRTLGEMGVPGMSRYANTSERDLQIEKHREKVRVDQSTESLRWLLANRVRTGMSVAEVSKELGLSAIRIYDDQRYKSDNGNYRSSDKAYKWGPMSDSTTVVLFFRDGSLVNFDPGEFQDGII